MLVALAGRQCVSHWSVELALALLGKVGYLLLLLLLICSESAGSLAKQAGGELVAKLVLLLLDLSQHTSEE